MRRDEIRQMSEQRAHLHAEMLKLNESTVKEKRSFSADEQEKYDKLEGEFTQIWDAEQRAVRLFTQQQEVDQTLSTPIEKRIGDLGDAPASFQEWKERRNGIRTEEGPEYRNAFYHYMGAGSLSDLDVEEHRALSKGTTTAGGFLVPTGFYNDVIRSIRDMGAIAELATTYTTDSGETIQVPANTAHGSASWTAEGIGYTPSDETFAQLSLGAYKSTAKIIVSEELLQDSAFALEPFLAREFGERLGVIQNTAFIKGDGSGKPTGILQTAGTASNFSADFTAATGSATSFTYTALVSAIFALGRQYRRNAVFVVNDTSARNLYLMVDGQQRPLWSVNVAEGGPDTFLGYPIYTDPDMPAPAAGAVSAIFADLGRAYLVRRVRGFGMQRQNELHSDNGQVGFRSFERVDGKVVLGAAGVGIKHSAT